MKILLIGEFSRLHWTLAEGLRVLGHEVCVASDGGGWGKYPCDILLDRPTDSYKDGFRCLAKILYHLPSFTGFDVVQVIHPYFLRIRAERTLPIYRFLRRHNEKVFLGAFGTDYYYVKACMETNTFRYSDFKIGDVYRNIDFNRIDIEECLHGGVAKANKEIAESCDGIISCLYEYDVSYRPYFPDKTKFIPLPINRSLVTPRVRYVSDTINFFIGIQAAKNELKGTDVMLPVLEALHHKYPDQCTITKVVSVPYDEYQRLLNAADVQLDQLYSYTPSMNSLLAMAKGIVVVGGGEEENYEILGETTLRPIVNVLPDADDVYRKLEELLLHKERISELSAQGIEYVEKYHDHVRVAQQYLDFWASR
ncbi:glycosyltransferase family 1 protein [Bacteroides sp. 214]|uniref:glycosyltransferase n=1 Tax=Bacteroides sp. 214 TaxID=2302935 RepID=UPI0013D020F5|nr:glycosyltransferase [Bacteroides sp. 214]NDW13130.1 glycosyltransferase family 1 protein [Bacteroides sp. 214]